MKNKDWNLNKWIFVLKLLKKAAAILISRIVLCLVSTGIPKIYSCPTFKWYHFGTIIVRITAY